MFYDCSFKTQLRKMTYAHYHSKYESLWLHIILLYHGGPTMKEKIYRSMVELTNGKVSSSLLQAIATASFSKRFIHNYSKLYGISLEEVSKNVDEFTSLHDFFTRKLKEHARPIAQGERVVSSPVDAKIESFGLIDEQTTIIVKEKPYQLTDLLGTEERAHTYAGGQFIVFYLSPADYHRIHSPLSARVVRQYVLGKKSYPVNQLGLTYGKKPISHNYRMISELVTTNDQHVAFIKVGAMFVNSIALTNTSDEWHKGEEVGYFTFGSTVVMLFEKNSVQFLPNVKQGVHIRMGESFASML